MHAAVKAKKATCQGVRAAVNANSVVEIVSADLQLRSGNSKSLTLTGKRMEAGCLPARACFGMCWRCLE